MSSVNETAERPLVTFALFAYNQEKFIREAVEGAFAQTYGPLEIILSDDCSTDRTFEIMQEMKDTYAGHCHVVVQKTPFNNGIWAHVLNVASKAQGELFVLAAGDDISMPNRVARLCEAWQKTGAWGLYSYMDRIDENSNIIDRNVILKMEKHFMRSYFSEGVNVPLIHGATSAYDRRAFSALKKLHEENIGPIFTEDGVMSFYLNAYEKKIVFLENSLVRYRSHSGSLSNSSSKLIPNQNEIVSSEKKAAFAGERFINLNRLFLAITAQMEEGPRSRVRIPAIESDLRFYEMFSHWTEKNFFGRLLFLVQSRRWKDIRWILPRLFGLEVFAYMKSIFKKCSQGAE